MTSTLKRAIIRFRKSAKADDRRVAPCSRDFNPSNGNETWICNPVLMGGTPMARLLLACGIATPFSRASRPWHDTLFRAWCCLQLCAVTISCSHLAKSPLYR